MLNKGHHTTPTFLEGTSGLYQRRESPPNVPGTAPLSFKQPSLNNNNSSATPSFHAQYYKHQSNPGSSTQLHSVNFNNNNNATLQHYAAQQSAYFGGQAPRPSASSISLPMVASNMVGGLTQTPAYIPQYTQNQQQAISPQRRLSHTPHGNNRVAPRSELSSHSFSSPRQLKVNNYGSVQEQEQELLQNHLLASSIPQIIQRSHGTQQLQAQQQQRYSVSSIPLASIQQQQHTNQNVRSGSELPRRILTSSLSIGNVVQHEQPFGFYTSNIDPATSSQSSKYHQQPQRTSMHGGNMRATSTGSAQSLSALQQQQHFMLRKHDSASPGLYESTATMGSELPLPPNWEADVTPDGYRFYIDHRNKRTSWVHPLAPENLPHGWTKIYDQLHGIVYYNELECRSQFEHPGLNLHHSSANSSTTATSKKPKLQQQQQTNALADRIRQSASIQSIIQHQKQQQQQFGGTQRLPANHQQHHQSQPLPLYQPVHPHYLTDIGSLNIITEEVPDWLKLYGEAPPQSDHLLNWDLFKLSQLQQFDAMLRKLYKQEVLNMVSKFERARGEINGELLRRFQRS